MEPLGPLGVLLGEVRRSDRGTKIKNRNEDPRSENREKIRSEDRRSKIGSRIEGGAPLPPPSNVAEYGESRMEVR